MTEDTAAAFFSELPTRQETLRFCPGGNIVFSELPTRQET